MTKNNGVLKKLAAILIVLSCTRCSSSLSITDPSMARTAESLLEAPAPTSAPIIDLTPVPGSNGMSVDRICAQMDQLSVWELGDSSDTLHKHISGHTVVTVDGKVVPIKEGDMSFRGFEVPKIEAGFVGDFLFCVEVDLKKGVHLAAIEVTTTAGRTLSYSWAFRVE